MSFENINKYYVPLNMICNSPLIKMTSDICFIFVLLFNTNDDLVLALNIELTINNYY